MSRLGHDLNDDMSLFPGDPAGRVRDLYTVAVDFFKVEDLALGTHAGTHIDVPAHFIGDGRTLDEFAAEEFVWPAYKLEVRGMTFTDNFVEVDDIVADEAEHGRIRSGSLVVLQTGAEAFFGAETVATETVDVGGEEFVISNNTDDLFDLRNAGFSGAAVQWLFDNRQIDGVGSDAYGPDAAGADFFDATFTILANDGVALVGLANLDNVRVRGDVIMAPAVSFTDGSGFSVDPLACHGKPIGQGRGR